MLWIFPVFFFEQFLINRIVFSHCSHKSNIQRTSNGTYLPETEIWSIVMQLTAGLRAIHQAGFACRYSHMQPHVSSIRKIRMIFEIEIYLFAF